MSLQRRALPAATNSQRVTGRIIDANKRRLYAKKLIELPFPEFVVFYNGTEDAPDHEELKLSTAYKRPKNAKGKPIKLELVVDVYNINASATRMLRVC